MRCAAILLALVLPAVADACPQFPPYDFSQCKTAAQYRVNVVLMDKESLFALCTNLVGRFSYGCHQKRALPDGTKVHDVYTLVPSYKNWDVAACTAGHELMHVVCGRYHQ